MLLHILTQRPGSTAYKDCLSAINEGDALLLIEDGVYAGNTEVLSMASNRIYALKPDSLARGLDEPVHGITWIDYTGFVELTLKYTKTVTWK
ncbi:sulfurtransferase complex subunit TusB [Lacimicrobium sp. SS2-24]|uniref:sulfurtransferase complex subunit TusB n=1 Tax=Lacimicrobium sp. SS2-24 TaxID=2005569 RepID=UPI000B4AEC67|nr:sulfurtransferase complex subunit TusB [Lacimicrobium sp. SS2-24]